MKYTEIAENHLKAAQKGEWDYPSDTTGLKSPKISNRVELLALINEGKTFEELYFTFVAKYGTITGAVFNHLGHTSNSTRSAVRKGFKLLLKELSETTK